MVVRVSASCDAETAETLRLPCAAIGSPVVYFWVGENCVTGARQRSV